jgi:hypothetical protein
MTPPNNQEFVENVFYRLGTLFTSKKLHLTSPYFLMLPNQLRNLNYKLYTQQTKHKQIKISNMIVFQT